MVEPLEGHLGVPLPLYSSHALAHTPLGMTWGTAQSARLLHTIARGA